MAKKAINLKYRSAERFHQDYKQLRKGHLFLPANKVLPRKTIIALHISVPGVDQVFEIDGAIISSLDPQAAEKLEKPAGMLVGILGGPDTIKKILLTALSGYAQDRTLLGLEKGKTESDPVCADEAAAQIDAIASRSPEFVHAQRQKNTTSETQELAAAERITEVKPAAQETTADQTAPPESMDDDDLAEEWEMTDPGHVPDHATAKVPAHVLKIGQV